MLSLIVLIALHVCSWERASLYDIVLYKAMLNSKVESCGYGMMLFIVMMFTVIMM